MFDDHCKQLLFKSIESNSEINDVRSDKYLRQEVRIHEFGEDVNFESFVVNDIFVSKLYFWHVIDNLDLLCKDIVQNSWQSFLNIDQQNG